MKANAEGGADDDGNDLLQEGALANFVAHRSALPFAYNATDNKDDSDSDSGDDMCMTFEGDGKIRILSKAEKKKEDDEKKRHALAEKLLRKNKTAVTAASFDGDRKRSRDDDGEGRRPARRGRGDDLDDSDQDVANEELILRYGSSLDADSARTRTAQLGSSGGPGSLKLHDEKRGMREAKRQRLENDIKKGEEYATGRGEGDVKRGKIDPFAYVPLNRRFINRRHRRQAVQRFDAVNYKVLKGKKSRFGAKVKANKQK
jgi:ribosomal RNA-processing protein 12